VCVCQRQEKVHRALAYNTSDTGLTQNGLAGGPQRCTDVTPLAIALKTSVSMSPPLRGEVTIHVQRLATTVNVSDANAVPTPSIVHQATTTTTTGWQGFHILM
jgi:hypothetical protein